MQSKPAKAAFRTQAFLQSLYALYHPVISIKALRRHDCRRVPQTVTDSK